MKLIIFKENVFNNKILLGAIALSASFMFIILLVPAFRNVFRKLAILIYGRWLFNNLPASKPFLEVIQRIATDWPASVLNSLVKNFLSLAVLSLAATQASL